MKKRKSPPSNGRLGNLILVDKKRLHKELSDFEKGVKTKEQVEANADVLFEHLRKNYQLVGIKVKCEGVK